MAPFRRNDTEPGKDESKCVSAAASFCRSATNLAAIEIDFLFLLFCEKQNNLKTLFLRQWFVIRESVNVWLEQMWTKFLTVGSET